MTDESLSGKQVSVNKRYSFYRNDVKEAVKKLKVQVHYFVRGTCDRNRLLNQIDKIFGKDLI